MYVASAITDGLKRISIDVIENGQHESGGYAAWRGCQPVAGFDPLRSDSCHPAIRAWSGRCHVGKGFSLDQTNTLLEVQS